MKKEVVQSRMKELYDFAKGFKTPNDIQIFLNSIPYSTHKICQSPYFVMKNRSAHCAEGAYFAAAVLGFMGFKPLVVDLSAENDDDHVIAVFKKDGLWGAVAKSNTTVLRYREPVYRTIRELVMSYFEMYFNTIGEKSLTGYTNPINMNRFNKLNWLITELDLDAPLGDALTFAKHFPLVPEKARKKLHKADPDLVKACFMTADPDGLFKPE